MPDLDPGLAAWREEHRKSLAGKSDDDLLAAAKSLDSPSRIAIWEKYRAIRAIAISNPAVEKNSIIENRWMLTLLSADRADAVRSRAANSKAAKSANGAASGPAPSLDDLLA